MKSRIAPILMLVLIAVATQGCSSLLGRTFGATGVYCGLRNSPGMGPFILVDAPLSAALDTALLPIDLTTAIHENRNDCHARFSLP